MSVIGIQNLDYLFNALQLVMVCLYLSIKFMIRESSNI